MIERKEYAIVRFFEQGGKCYKIDDVTEGSNLLQFMKDGERIEKRELFLWFTSLAEQLEFFHKSMKQGYGHVNPYAVIISEEGKAVLLDIEAKENSELLKHMQKRNFRSLFVRDESSTMQVPKPGDDVFGFGKLLLFMMEKGKFEVEFTKIEKIKLKRIIERCTNKEGNVGSIFKNIQKELNKMSRAGGARQNWGMKMLVTGIALIAVILGVMTLNSKSVIEEQETMPAEIKEPVVYEEPVLYDEEEGERLSLELGMLYYTELGDCAGAREILSRVKGESRATEIYLQLLDYIQTGTSLDEGQWSKLWQELKEEWERLGVQNKLWYKIPVLEACKIKNTIECWKIICEIGEDAEANRIWNGIADNPEKEVIFLQYLGEAYEAIGEEEKYRETYESLKQLETDREQLEEISEEVVVEAQEETAMETKEEDSVKTEE